MCKVCISLRRNVLKKLLLKKVSLNTYGKRVIGMPTALKEDDNFFYITIEHQQVKHNGTTHYRRMFVESKENGTGTLKEAKIIENETTSKTRN